DVDPNSDPFGGFPEVRPVSTEKRLAAAHRAADDRTLVAKLRAAFELTRGDLRIVRGDVRQQDQTIGCLALESGCPVVVDPRDLLVQHGVVELELCAGRAVDHLRVHAVAVHVLESRPRLAGPEAMVVSGDEARFLAAAGRDTLAVAEPPRPFGRLFDVRTAFAPLPGQT